MVKKIKDKIKYKIKSNYCKNNLLEFVKIVQEQFKKFNLLFKTNKINSLK